MLSEAMFDILLSLAHGPLHGYGMIKTIHENRQNQDMQPGLLYVTIPKLLQSGLIEEAEKPADNPDPRRKYYQLRPKGRTALCAEAEARMSYAQKSSKILGIRELV